MTASAVASEVVIALNLEGQGAFLKGMQASSAAVTDLADAVVAANDKIIGSNADVAKSNAAVAGSAGTSATTQAAAADRNVAASTESADAMVANNERVAASAKTAAGTAVEANKSVLGALTSLKSLALGASVYAGIESFNKYQTNLTLLTTQAGLASSKLGAVKSAIDALTNTVGISKINLAGAMYNPISEGFNISQATTIEKYASQLARIGGSPLTGSEGTSYALSTMMQVYGQKPTQTNVAKMAALINAGVGAGDMHLSDLLAAEGTGIFNTARTYGVSPKDMMGELDFFTSQGVSAQSAATRSRMMLALLAAPSSQGTGILEGLNMSQSTATGLEAQMAALGVRPSQMASIIRGPNGIANAFMALNQHMAGMSPTVKEDVMSKLFGGGRSSATALAILNNPALLTKFTNRVGAMSSPARLEQDWAAFQKTFAGQWGDFTADLSNLATGLGQTVTPALEGFIHALEPLLKFLTGNKIATEALAGAIGGALTLELVNVGRIAGTSLVGGLRTAAGWINKFGDSAVLAGSKATGAAGKEGVLAAAELTEGDDAAAAALKNQVLGGSFLTRVGLPAAAVSLGYAKWASEYDKINYGGLPKAAQQNSALKWLTSLHPANAAQVTAMKKVFGEIQDDLYEQGPRGWALDLTKVGLPKPPNFESGGTGGLLGPSGLAAGGTIGGGFVTNGPRAIVGEGNPAHPEYVIPTDPTYRAQALGLYSALGGHLMATGGILTAANTLTQGLEGAMYNLIGGGSFQALLASVLTQIGATGGIGSQGGALDALMGGASGTTGLISTGGISSAHGFAVALLRALGDPATAANVSSLVTWEGREGGNWANTARFNPLNTTYAMQGSTAMNSDGVQAFASWSQGLTATVDTLRGGGYNDILSALKGGRGLGSGVSAGLSRWSGGGYSSLAAGGVLGTAKQKGLPFGLYDVGGYLPEGLSIAFNGTGAPEPVGHGALGGDITVVNEVYLDGKTVYQSVKRHVQNEVARR